VMYTFALPEDLSAPSISSLDRPTRKLSSGAAARWITMEPLLMGSAFLAGLARSKRWAGLPSPLIAEASQCMQ